MTSHLAEDLGSMVGVGSVVAGSAVAASAGSMVGVPFERHEVVRVGMVGPGDRGRDLLRNLGDVDGVEVTAIWDADAESARAGREVVVGFGARPPAICPGGEAGLAELLGRDDVDLVVVATPWRWHTPIALEAMRAGKHVAVEVPAAVSIEECWALVEESERSRRHCLLLENCCYGEQELLVLNMVKDGLLGRLLHAEAAYIHDLREYLFAERAWRRREHVDRPGNLYPTHGLGPVAMYLGINRGDRLATLVSMSSPALGLGEWADAHLPASDPARRETYRCGDVNTSLIKTAAGRTIVLQHQVSTPRPYDRLNVVVGTRGVFKDFPPRIFLDGQAGPEEYTDLSAWRQRYEHHLWRDLRERALRSGGHGGMDYIMLARLVELMRAGAVPDTDVYDAATWSAPGPLSDISVDQGSAPVQVPDFTRGAWHTARPRIE